MKKNPHFINKTSKTTFSIIQLKIVGLFLFLNPLFSNASYSKLYMVIVIRTVI